MKLLDGKVVAQYIKDNLRYVVDREKLRGESFKLAIIRVGNDEASSVYIRNKVKACEELGIESEVISLPEDTTTLELYKVVGDANYDDSINGIIVQLPLPDHLKEDADSIIECIDPDKDVDCMHPTNVGKMFISNTVISRTPCTAHGIIKILNYYNIDITGKECVVVGRSNIVGKPVAMMLQQENGTVTMCHSKTENLKEICKRADILVCAIGKPKFFNEEYVKDGAVVIDVGIHRMDNGKLCGDVDFDAVKDIVSAITPVPGGVGCVTVAMLMENLYCAAFGQQMGRSIDKLFKGM